MKKSINKTTLVVVAIMAAVAFASCKKELETFPTFEEKIAGQNIIIAGNQLNNKYFTRPICWVVGDEQPLHEKIFSPGRNFSAAIDLCISGNDVYVLGYEQETSTARKQWIYWKNGVNHPFGDPNDSIEAKCILVVGSDVYVGGSIIELGGPQASDTNSIINKGAYWKNGQKKVLWGGPNFNLVDIVGLALHSGDNKIYYTGHYYADTSMYRYRSLMFNTIESTISQLHYMNIANDMLYYNQKMYLPGAMFNNNPYAAASYMEIVSADDPRQSKLHQLETQKESQALGIVVEKDTVHCAGYSKENNVEQPMYWVEKPDMSGPAPVHSVVRTVLPTEGAMGGRATGIAIRGNDVYVAGYENLTPQLKRALLWKNGKRIPLTNAYSEATKVIIK